MFFLLYRCVFGFALLNVVTSVFVQQTMKTANSDEELAFKQKEKDKALYNRSLGLDITMSVPTRSKDVRHVLFQALFCTEHSYHCIVLVQLPLLLFSRPC